VFEHALLYRHRLNFNAKPPYLQPKKPLFADKPEGCAAVRT